MSVSTEERFLNILDSANSTKYVYMWGIVFYRRMLFMN